MTADLSLFINLQFQVILQWGRQNNLESDIVHALVRPRNTGLETLY